MAQQITLFDDIPLELALGGTLSPINVAYQTYGTLNAEKSNAVLLCHALTGDAEPYYAPPADKGWWQDFIGAGLAFDTDKYFFYLLECAWRLQRYDRPFVYQSKYE